MQVLFKSFSIRQNQVVDGVGSNCITHSFSLRRYGAKNGYTHNMSSYFDLTLGGYTIDGIVLPIMLDESKIIRIK